ncbi:MAG: ABC transporter permease [Phycisphaerales bacterium]|nr:ABC transporter permease [Phycisphaerales bacterium]
MGKVFTLALKDLTLLRRDLFAMFWVVAFPLVFGLFFGAIFGGAGDGARSAMPIVIVDQDQTDGSTAFIDRLDASTAINVEPSDDPEASRDLVRRGKRVACIVVRDGFGKSFGGMFGGESLLEITIDPSRGAEQGMLQGLLQEAMYRSVIDRFRDSTVARESSQSSIDSIRADEGIDPIQKAILLTFMGSLDTFLGTIDPAMYEDAMTFDGGGGIETVEVETESRGPTSFEISFPQAMMWGVIGCAAAFAISIVQERTGGTFLRLRVSPISRAQILAGKGLACFLAITGVLVGMLLVETLILGVRLGNPAGLVLAVVCTGVCFVGIMMLVSVIGKTEQAVAGAGWAAFLVMAMLGGGMVPVFFMPRWMYMLSHASPVQWGITAIQGATWRGYSFTELLPSCGLLVGVGIACYVIGVRVLAITDR